MSSRDRSIRHVRRAVLGLAVGALLAGCANVGPLYGTRDLSAPSAPRSVDQLKRIEVSRIGSDIGFELRRQLVFSFHGGADDDGDGYVLTITVAPNNLTTTTLPTNSPSAVPMFIQVTADFTLVDKTTREVLYTGTSFANASFDSNNQHFSNLRAQRDAEQRAGRLIARDIHTKIAAYFATAHQDRS